MANEAEQLCKDSSVLRGNGFLNECVQKFLELERSQKETTLSTKAEMFVPSVLDHPLNVLQVQTEKLADSTVLLHLSPQPLVFERGPPGIAAHFCNDRTFVVRVTPRIFDLLQ